MQLEIKTLELTEERNVYIEGYASSVAKDIEGEVISKEALEAVAKEIVAEPYNKVFLNHNTKDIPIGKIIDAKVVDGKLFVRIVLNKAHKDFETVYKSLKEGFLNALSIGFNAIKRESNVIKELKVLEVSIVSLPANPEAKVLNVYEKMLVKGVVPEHPWRYGKDDEGGWEKPNLSDFTDKAWDELSEEEKRSIAGHFAWAPKNPPERFTDLKLPHHDPKSHAVVWRGVVAAMAALMGARGGVDIPEEDRKKVYNHLAKHYEEFGREPPEFRSVDELAEKYAEGQFVLKSLNLKAERMEVEKLQAEIEKLKAENESLKKKLVEYESREKQAIIEKIKKIANDVDEKKLAELDVLNLKAILADYAIKFIDKSEKAEKVKTVVEDQTFIETKWGRADVRKLAEIRKAFGIEEVK